MIDVNKPIKFYDDRGKTNGSLMSTTVKYVEDELCVCHATFIDENNEVLSINEKIVFNLETREVYNPDYQFWLAENVE